jgi:hypothetical protein
MGSSFVDYRGRGFWTRDAALETVLALLVAELQPLSRPGDALSALLDEWALQASVGFMGCVSPGLDQNLTDPDLVSAVTAALRHVLARLPADGLVTADDPDFAQRAQRVSEGQWRSPSALAAWVAEVSKALLELIEGDLPATPDDFWFVDGTGRRKRPRLGRDTGPGQRRT